jgi:glucosamine--fructose-6-phosphate aminotransferase (isomerizing)
VADARAGRIAGGVVVVLSQSGASVTSIEAAMAARVAGRDVLSITAEAASPLARGGGPLLVMPIGPEPIGPKTKGFTASVATLLALAGAPGDPGASFAIALAAAPDWAGRLIDRADRADMVLVTASGALYGIALEASLKIAEIAGIPTACFPWEEVLHGRLHGLTPASVCVVIVDDARTRAEAERARIAMHARGVAIDLLDLADDLPPPWSILAGVTPFQWLAVRLAERRGMAPEAMRYPGLSADLAIKTNPPP